MDLVFFLEFLLSGWLLCLAWGIVYAPLRYWYFPGVYFGVHEHLRLCVVEDQCGGGWWHRATEKLQWKIATKGRLGLFVANIFEIAYVLAMFPTAISLILGLSILLQYLPRNP